jgi:hypothetical protein
VKRHLGTGANSSPRSGASGKGSILPFRCSKRVKICV